MHVDESFSWTSPLGASVALLLVYGAIHVLFGAIFLLLGGGRPRHNAGVASPRPLRPPVPAPRGTATPRRAPSRPRGPRPAEGKAAFFPGRARPHEREDRAE